MPLLNYTTAIAATKTAGEIWRPVPIPGYENIYSISSKGRVRREVVSGPYPAGYVLKPKDNRYGYWQIRLRKPGGNMAWALIHRLVAAAFIGPSPKPGMDVNHKDGNRRNNVPSNLEWVTPRENRRHAIDVLGDDRRGEAHPCAKLTEQEVLSIRKRAKRGEPLARIAEDFCMNVEYIRLIVKRKRWKHI